MAFWRRIRQSQIHTKLWNQFTTTRSYLQIRSPVTVTDEPTRIWFLTSPRFPAKIPQFEVPTNVRFFAKKKVKPKPKPKMEEKEDRRPRLNEEIPIGDIRLVNDEGHSIMSKHEALKLARSLNLDLVEVQRNVTPPVCKIKDYLKEKYKLETKEKERAKEKSAVTLRQGACKEIRFSGKITQKDLQVKADAAKRLMEQGYRVKCVGVGNTSSESGESSTKLLSRFSALIEDVAIVESQTRVEDKDQIHVIMRHAKYGPSKKGSAKKAADRDKKSAKETEDTDGEETENPGWTAVGANDDFGQLFDIPEDVDKVSKCPSNETWSSAGGTLRSSGDGRETTCRAMPEFSNVARQPQPQLNRNVSRSPQTQSRESGGGFGEFSMSKSSSKFPQQGFTPNMPGSPTPKFGIFGTQESASEKHGGAVEVNRYKQRTGPESQRSPRPMGNGNNNRDMSSSRDGSGQATKVGW